VDAAAGIVLGIGLICSGLSALLFWDRIMGWEEQLREGSRYRWLMPPMRLWPRRWDLYARIVIGTVYVMAGSLLIVAAVS